MVDSDFVLQGAGRSHERPGNWLVSRRVGRTKMRGTRVRERRAIIIGVGFLCLAVLVVGARTRKDHQSKESISDGSAKKLLVSRMKQPGSPLTLSRVSVD